jgi:hypothetical protein
VTLAPATPADELYLHDLSVAESNAGALRFWTNTIASSHSPAVWNKVPAQKEVRK